MDKIVAGNIKKFRLEKGLTQELLAYELHISREYLSRLEHGVKHASMDLLDRIAELTGHKIQDFFEDLKGNSGISSFLFGMCIPLQAEEIISFVV